MYALYTLILYIIHITLHTHTHSHTCLKCYLDLPFPNRFCASTAPADDGLPLQPALRGASRASQDAVGLGVSW